MDGVGSRVLQMRLLVIVPSPQLEEELMTPPIAVSKLSSLLNRNPSVELKAFTVVELMVTLAIITILFTLSLKGLEGFRDRSKIVQCLGNVRGMGVALHVYASDNNSHLPELSPDNVEIEGIEKGGALDIRYELVPYDSRFWNIVCPADRRADTDPNRQNPTYISYIYCVPAGVDLAKVDRAIPIVLDSGFYHGKRGAWKGTFLFSDNHCEVKKH
jgi:prepilin-type N-terminal cleavage/methylation domain-containing protein